MLDRLPITIRGVGCAVPERVVTNDEFARTLDTSDEWIRTRSGIRERRIAGPGENTLTLAAAASRRALASAGIEPGEIDLIIVATCTPYMPLPATACFLQQELGCRQVAAFDLAAACSGFVYAFSIASRMVATGGCRNALVVGAETLSSITDFQDRSVCVLLGDGAGAAVVGPAGNGTSGIYHQQLGADGSGAQLIWVPAGGSAEPATARTVNERLHYMRMKGREVYRFAVTKMQEVILEAVRQTGISPEDLALIIPHQSNLRIIESAAERLGVPMSRVAVNIDRYGNTSAASIPLALAEAWEQGRVRTGDWVLMAGFGAGLTWGSILMRL